MLCPKCRSENSGDAAFCEQCGVRLEAKCPNCQTPVGQGARFCKKCGVVLGGRAPVSAGSTASEIRTAPEAAVAETIEGERKTVTALFADLKGSTRLMEGIDPEEARTIIDPALRIMVEAVRRYEGYVVQSTGDGIFALFGAPAAYEDHLQRALYAALQMQQELREHGHWRGHRDEAAKPPLRLPEDCRANLQCISVSRSIRMSSGASSSSTPDRYQAMMVLRGSPSSDTLRTACGASTSFVANRCCSKVTGSWS